MDCVREFYGHAVCQKGLLRDVQLPFFTLLLLLALISLVFLVKRLWVKGNFEKFIAITLIVGLLYTGKYFFFYFPNATYLFFEIRHLINPNDNIADGFEPPAIIIFSALSFLGLFLTITTIILATNGFGLKGCPKWFAVAILSFLTVFGGILGLHEINSVDGIRNFGRVLEKSIEIAKIPLWWVFIIPMTVFILVLTVAVDTITLRIWQSMKPHIEKLWN